jgi:hypothetical protein
MPQKALFLPEAGDRNGHKPVVLIAQFEPPAAIGYTPLFVIHWNLRRMHARTGHWWIGICRKPFD